MMEGFRRHENTSKERTNPIELAKQQNDEIKQSIEALGREQLAKKLDLLKKENERKEKMITDQKRKLLEQKQFYDMNAPPHVQTQSNQMFTELKKHKDSRFVELNWLPFNARQHLTFIIFDLCKNF